MVDTSRKYNDNQRMDKMTKKIWQNLTNLNQFWQVWSRFDKFDPSYWNLVSFDFISDVLTRFYKRDKKGMTK